MYATYGIFCWRLDARFGFVSIVSHGVLMLLLASFGIDVGVATVGVATLGVGLSTSCPVAFLGSCGQELAYCVSVATSIFGALIVSSYVSCRMSSRGSRIVEYYL
jgi:hypothetical protein